MPLHSNSSTINKRNTKYILYNFWGIGTKFRPINININGIIAVLPNGQIRKPYSSPFKCRNHSELSNNGIFCTKLNQSLIYDNETYNTNIETQLQISSIRIFHLYLFTFLFFIGFHHSGLQKLCCY